MERNRRTEHKEHNTVTNRLSWARLVSNLLSPPLVWAVMVFPIAFRDAETTAQALTWALTYCLLVCVLPLLYVVWMVRRGHITDLHMELRQQRIRPFIVSILFTTAAWWTLRLMGAPAVVPLFTLIGLVQIVIVALITLVWQISMHAMSISGLVVAAFAFFGALPALLLLPLVILVAAARLKLQRHTPAQIVAGAAVGVLVPIVIFAIS